MWNSSWNVKDEEQEEYTEKLHTWCGGQRYTSKNIKFWKTFCKIFNGEKVNIFKTLKFWSFKKNKPISLEKSYDFQFPGGK
jgi:hypothetical protein